MKLYVNSLVIALSLASVNAYAIHSRNPAQTTAANTSSTPSGASSYGNDYSSGSGYSGGPKFALGYRRSTSTVGDISFGQLSGMVEFKPGLRGGLDFGFVSDFDNFAFNAEFQADMITRGAAAMFFEADAGFLRVQNATADIKAFAPALLLGLAYNLTSNLQFSTAFGVQMAFGDGTDGNHVAITTAPDFAGNFAFRWWF